MIRMPPQSINSVVRREADRRALIRLGLVFACGLVLTIGFVRAAAQHTAAVRQGYRSEELRRERARLLAEQRRLQLAVSEAQSPQQLEERAREIGLGASRSVQFNLSAAVGGARRTPVAAPLAATAAATGLRRASLRTH